MLSVVSLVYVEYYYKQINLQGISIYIFIVKNILLNIKWTSYFDEVQVFSKDKFFVHSNSWFSVKQMSLLVHIHCINISIPFTFSSAQTYVFMSFPYTYQGQLSFGLSLLYCWCMPRSNCHSSAAGGHTFYTSSRSFPWNQYTIHYMHFKPILSQTKMCVKHSLPNYEKITLTFDLKDDLDSILTLNFHYIIKSFCTVAQ